MVPGEAAGRALGQSSCLADDDSPVSDGPGCDQAIANVRIAVNETLNDGAIVGPPNKNRSIRRFGEGACEDQVPPAMGFPSKRKMLIAEAGAPSEIVINQCVLQQVVTHVESVYGLTTDGQVRGGEDLPLILGSCRTRTPAPSGQRADGYDRNLWLFLAASMRRGGQAPPADGKRGGNSVMRRSSSGIAELG